MVIRFLLLLLLTFPLPGGLEFDSTGWDVATCGSSADIDNLSGLTISMWANFLSTGGDGGNDHVLSKFNFTTLTTGWRLIYHQNNNDIYFIVLSDEGVFRRYWSDGADNTLYHIAVTWTGNFGVANDEIDIWVNGVERDNYGTDQNGTQMDDSALDLLIGRNEPNDDLDGQLQCVALWEGALSDNSIKSLAKGNCRTALRVSEGTPLRYFEMMDGYEGEIVTGADSILESTRDEHCTTSDNLTFRAMKVRR